MHAGDPSILDHVGQTPLVRLHRIAAGRAAPVFAKCEHLNPGGSVKDRIAVAIVADAERRGLLAPGATIVEGTGGNTGVGLALVAAVRGYRLVCVMPEKMSHDKRTALRVLGAEVVITRDAPPDDPDHFNNVAARLARDHGWFLADQFRNAANVRVHAEQTAGELLEQAPGRIAAFVCGVGTGGTITGVGRRLKAVDPAVRIVLADPIGSKLAGWARGGDASPDAKYALEGIGGSKVPEILDLTVIDEVEQVGDAEAFAMTRRLIREEGLLVGGSSGAMVVAALRTADRLATDGIVVTVLPDSWDRYWSKDWLSG